MTVTRLRYNYVPPPLTPGGGGLFGGPIREPDHGPEHWVGWYDGKLEIGVDAPLLAIHSASFVRPRTAVSIGDVNFHLKYNFYKEREGSRLPAFALNINIELPTGNTSKKLGSGFTDYFLNGILQ